MAMSERICVICGENEDNHRKLELTGFLHHKLSETGAVVPSTAIEEENSKKAQEAKAAASLGPADTVLRALLADLGLFTMDDLARKELELRDERSRTRP